MIYIGFALRNPFSQRFDAVWTKDVRVTENKSIDMGLYKNNSILGFSFNITGLKQDHKGFSFDVELLGYSFDFNFYDNRHHEHY